MDNQLKSDLEKSVEKELNFDELMSVEGGNDSDCDEDSCSKALQCVTRGDVSCYSGVNG